MNYFNMLLAAAALAGSYRPHPRAMPFGPRRQPKPGRGKRRNGKRKYIRRASGYRRKR